MTQLIKKNQLLTKTDIISIGLIMLAAFLIRISGILLTGFGDEVKVIAPALEIARDYKLVTVSSYYPYGFINVLALIFFIPARICPSCDYTFFLHVGRGVSSLLGTATILLTFIFIIENFKNKTFAYFALIILAFLPSNVTFSRYVFTEGFIAFLTIIIMILCGRIAKNGNKKLLLITSALTGLAAATKYHGGINIFLVILSYSYYLYLYNKKQFLQKLIPATLLVGAISLISFLLSMYQNVILWHTTADILKDLQIRHSQGDLGFSSSSWLFNLTGNSLEFDFPLMHASLLRNLGVFTFMFALLGMVALFIWERKRVATYMLIVFFVAFYAFINLSGQTRGIKYYIPLFPIVGIFTAYPLSLIYQQKNVLLKAGAAGVMCLLIFGYIQHLYMLTRVLQANTVPNARVWIKKNIPKNSVIVQFAAIPVADPADLNYTLVPWQNVYKHTYPSSTEIRDDRAPTLAYWRKEHKANYVILNGRHALKYYDKEVQKRYPEMIKSYLSFFRELDTKTELVAHWKIDEKNKQFDWPDIKIYKIN